ncbi:MAG TPA: hypothetical protein VN739_08750 [Nitrososphaerales archaeon]|nr:hypothetical protein [Nitrososphaerales archaeon]
MNSLRSNPQNVRIIILWSFFVGVMILGGYAVYYQVLGIGQTYQHPQIDAELSTMLFVFGIYLLALVLHGYLINQK